jgi:flagellar motor switch/type III secretory pathway protein FliN
MSQLTHEAVERVAATCQAHLGEIGASLTRALDAAIAATAARAEMLVAAALPVDWTGAGLIVMLTVDASAALVVLAEKDGLLPAWCAKPDVAGQSKLQTLARELGALVLPSDLVPGDFRVGHVGSISRAIQGGELTFPAGCVALKLSVGARHGAAKVIWPARQPSAIFAVDGASWPAKVSLDRAESTQGARRPLAAPSADSPYPPYLQSLLQIPVSLSVTLVSKRQPMQRILELGPGSILPFDKPCTAPLTLEVAGHGIAEGEAVKVGDKFGLRLTSLILPGERMAAVRGSDNVTG